MGKLPFEPGFIATADLLSAERGFLTYMASGQMTAHEHARHQLTMNALAPPPPPFIPPPINALDATEDNMSGKAKVETGGDGAAAAAASEPSYGKKTNKINNRSDPYAAGAGANTVTSEAGQDVDMEETTPGGVAPSGATFREFGAPDGPNIQKYRKTSSKTLPGAIAPGAGAIAPTAPDGPNNPKD